MKGAKNGTVVEGEKEKKFDRTVGRHWSQKRVWACAFFFSFAFAVLVFFWLFGRETTCFFFRVSVGYVFISKEVPGKP